MDRNVEVFKSFEKLGAHKEVETCFSAALMEFTMGLSKVLSSLLLNFISFLVS